MRGLTGQEFCTIATRKTLLSRYLHATGGKTHEAELLCGVKR